MKPITLVACLFTATFMCSPAGALSPEARGTAMGGTLTPFASGAEGLWWNDAALGKPLLLSADLGFGLEGGNNALTLSQISGLAQQSAKGKADALAAIRKEGSWNARIETAGIAAVTLYGIGIGVIPHAMIQAKDVSPDAAELAINGTIPATSGYHYVIKGDYSRSVYTEYMAGYAHDLPAFVPGVNLSAGAALKYIIGSDFDHVKTNQDFNTGAPVTPSSDSEHTQASKGTGFGVDLGLQASFMGVLKAGLAVRNLGAKITWDTKQQVGYFDQSTLTFISHTGTGSAVTTLPTTLLLGAGGSIPVVGTSVGAALEADTTNKETKLHLGAEQSFAGIFALRAGYVTGAGPSPAQVTFGLGLGAIVAHVDLGAGVALNGKGGSASLSANLNF